MSKELIERIYNELPLGRIPWNIEVPPSQLVELVETRKIKPCKVIDLGCGTGNYAAYLASRGFEVTGVDFSEKAIEYAREKAREKGLECNFLVANVFDLNMKEEFDFAYDWELLHHIMPEERVRYVEVVHRFLKARGGYLSVCFNERSPEWGGGKYRITPLKTVLYYSSEEELKDLFEPFFNIIESRLIQVGKAGSKHVANYFFMEKCS